MKKLVIAGTGIKTVAHITEETKGYIQACDKVVYLINEPAMQKYISNLAKSSENLDELYFSSTMRSESYKKISEKVIQDLEVVNSVCLVLYGHPSFFAIPGLLAASKIELDNIETIICPAVSSLDCLLVDLKLDPGNGGLQILDATEFLLYNKPLLPSTNVLLYQVAMVGNTGLPNNPVNKEAFAYLKDKLISLYSKDKIIYLYEAALYPRKFPVVLEISLGDFSIQNMTTLTTVYIPSCTEELIPDNQFLEIVKRDRME